MTQILELTDKGFKIAMIINIFKDLKDGYNEWTNGKSNKETEAMGKKIQKFGI